MDSGFYAACAGLRAKSQALEIVANNVANLNSTGFRSHRATFRSLLMRGDSSSTPLNRALNDFGVLGDSRLDLAGGSTEQTGNSAPYRHKNFEPAENQLRVMPRLKTGINFSRLNLLDDARMAFMKSMDVIFWCNVLIYFDVLSKRHVIQHFYNNLVPHGYLFLGHSESLFGITDEFRLVHLPSTTAYVKSQFRQATGRAQ